MELRHLEVLVAVAETGTVTAAGQRLGTVQSAVSATLRALEEEVGAELFTRTARRAVLTEAGQAMLPDARAALAGAERARAAVRESQEGLRGHLAVGTMTSLQVLDLPRLLGRLHRSHPGVSVGLSAHPGGSAGLVEAVAAGTLDLAFVSIPGVPPPGVRLRAVARVPLRPLVPRGHRLAGATSVSLADLAGERWVDSPAGFGNRAAVDAALARSGLVRTVALEVMDVTAMPDYVAAGLGVAAVPEMVPIDVTEVSAPALRGPPVFWPLAVATAAGRPERAVVRAFLAQIPAELKAMAPAYRLGDGGPAPRPALPAR